VLTTGDGGMLTTPHADWDRRLRLLRQHGMSVPDTVRHSAATPVFETHEILGYNYRMTDIQAAVGRAQLRRLPGMVRQRRRLAARYAELLGGTPGLVLPAEPTWARSNWQSYCVRLPDGCDQRRVMGRLLEAGVASRRGIMNAHEEPAYPPGAWSCGTPQPCPSRCPAGSCRRLPESEAARRQGLLLPLFCGMTDNEQQRVAAALRQACAEARPEQAARR
jgi:dTDP-4-amino-4,6-dideoxygalactose transaminase